MFSSPFRVRWSLPLMDTDAAHGGRLIRAEFTLVFGRWLLALVPLLAGPALAQAVFDAMFSDMDINLRELGVGDLSVGRRIRKLAEGFYGRANAYRAALREKDDNALMVLWGGGLVWTIDGLGSMLGKTPTEDQFEPGTWALYQHGKQVH